MFAKALFHKLCFRIVFFTQNDGYYREGDHPRNSQLRFPLQLHTGGSGRRPSEGPCVRLFHKIGLGEIFSCMLPGPPGFTIIGTHILLKLGLIRLFFMVVHVQTQNDNYTKTK